jgi:hypothetical protein
VDPPTLDRLARWLARADVVAHDPPRVRALRAALGGEHVSVERHGGIVCYAPGRARRRLLQFDRRGHVTAALAWDDDGRLAWATCRAADGRMIGIEPGAASHPAWGRSDRLWLVADEPGWRPERALTVFQAVDWSRPAAIPALAEPARLPAGAGTAVLDLLAGVMRDRDVARVRYQGPYPTEALFEALLESFHYDPNARSPLDAFVTGEALDWTPAPHERHHVAPGVCVQLRAEVDKVVLAGAAFYRPDWQAVIRREPRVVRKDGERVICSLWALGRPLEDRLILDRSGEVLETPAPRSDLRPPAPMPPVWTSALAELIARESPPILAAPIRAALRAVDLEWGSVPGDLVRVEPGRMRVSRALRDVGLAWVDAAPEPGARPERAIHLVLEVAHLLAPEIRRRAQAALAALPEVEQQRRWSAAEAAPPPGVTEATGRLVALIAGGRA